MNDWMRGPDYIDELADLADPDKLWRLPGLEQIDLPPEKRRQLDMGVYLRRHAANLRDLQRALDQKKSWLITPLGPSSTARMIVDTPEDHEKLRPKPSPMRDPTPDEGAPF